MENQDLSCFKKGKFLPIMPEFLDDTLQVSRDLAKIQKKYNKPDNDSILNEFRDAMVAQYLGFSQYNSSKHGFDAKLSVAEDVLLESKVAMWDSHKTATFNDTTEEKARAFMDEKVWLALSVWDSAANLLFICYGQNEKIGEYLLNKVKEQTLNSKRRTQSISLGQLISEYGFKILTISLSKEELYMKLTATGRTTLSKIDRDIIVELPDFTPPYLKDPNDRIKFHLEFWQKHAWDGLIGFSTEQICNMIALQVKSQGYELDDEQLLLLEDAIKSLQTRVTKEIETLTDKQVKNISQDFEEEIQQMFFIPFTTNMDVQGIEDYLAQLPVKVDEFLENLHKSRQKAH